jgi:hypothetical protein
MKAGNFLFTYVFFSTIFFSRNDVSGQRFREAEGEASPQSPPAGALLLKKKEEKKKKIIRVLTPGALTTRRSGRPQRNPRFRRGCGVSFQGQAQTSKIETLPRGTRRLGLLIMGNTTQFHGVTK